MWHCGGLHLSPPPVNKPSYRGTPDPLLYTPQTLKTIFNVMAKCWTNLTLDQITLNQFSMDHLLDQFSIGPIFSEPPPSLATFLC